ncbi:MAG: spore maturation protein A [Clostridia bacterium]|nr:spore maturation protein A [Clostridia bacterium]
MMNYVWAGMIILAYVFAVSGGRTEAVTQSALDGAKGAVDMVISLLGMMCFWTGLLEIAKRSGLTEKLAKLASPLMRILFPKLKKEKEAQSAIIMNMIANFLGLSNAATPLGIKAMEELDRINGKKQIASSEMCMFVVINTASITLMPTTLITLRSAAGSTEPFSVIVPVWICSVLSVTAGIVAAKLFDRREDERGLCRRLR